MERLLAHLMVIASIASMALVACAPAAPAPAPTSAPTAAPRAAEPTKPVEATKAPAPATSAPAAKVDYPQKGRSITAIVPFAAGGATDISARVVRPFMERELGTPIQIVNKGGGGSQVGNTEVALAKPDGYTLAYMAMPTIITSYLDPERKAAYTRKSFEPVGRPTADSIVIAVRADSPYKTVKDLMDAAKASPEKIKAAVSGPMSVNHIPMLMMERQSGVKFAAVHFDGSRPGITAMLGGHVDTAFALVSEVQPQFKAGEIRVLAVLDSQESEFLPGVPTLESQGYKIYMLSSHAIAAPAGTPREIVNLLSSTLKKVVDNPDVKARLKNAGQNPRYLDAEQLAAFWEQSEAEIRPLMELGKQK